ncbi:MAG: hypothetical protein IH851_11945 [Armatimonadetes bacterium]|nr:hypothetical protein [Armatimonadota bacterium]
MSQQRIRSGTIDELRAHTGDWLFIDIGFARGKKTCGYLLVRAGGELAGTEHPAKAVTYGSLTREVVLLVQKEGPPLHFVIEAPLSVAFGADGNPLGRTAEKRDNQTRYWYVGLGCSVLVASLYLMQAVIEAKPAREVRMFEGLVSFRDRFEKSDHAADVEALKQVVWSGGNGHGMFREPAAVDCQGGSHIASTMALLDLDSTPPPIVEVTG